MGLEDIQVQLQASGIYFVGIPRLIAYIDAIFYPLIEESKPVTRVDLNCFVQHDLGFLDKSMFISRKKKYGNIFKEYGNKASLETLYIGRSPFKLRIYDKKNSPKKMLMENYFILNDMKLHLPIFNIEFELKRDFLKTYKLLDVTDVLENTETLFIKCTELICLKDIPKDQEDRAKYEAPIHPLWEHITKHYKITSLKQKQEQLEAIQKRRLDITSERAALDHQKGAG